MTDDVDFRAAAGAVLAEWPLAVAAIAPITVGLINQTFLVTAADGTRYVLQCLHPIFPGAVNANIEAVTRHLAARGQVTTRLVPARNGASWIERETRVWRLLTHVAGTTFTAMPDADHARAAGRGLARFHVALADLDYAFPQLRPPVHELPRHLATLEGAIAECGSHRLHGAAAQLAAEIRARCADLPQLPRAPARVVHGDPKISNFIFGEDGTCRALVDLDTVGRGPLVFDLGDAFRSWCNPAGEDAAEGRFALPLFAAALEGYGAAACDFLTAAEIAAIVPATLTIQLELAARFCADALHERYFGWDAARYASRGEHNLVRARNQLGTAAALGAQAAEAAAAVARAFAA
jgi:Ser/Thr protein kinase RdoA (MazF antagonist)